VHYLSLLFTDLHSIFLIIAIAMIISNSNPVLQHTCIYFQLQVVVAECNKQTLCATLTIYSIIKYL